MLISPGHLISESFELYKANWKKLLPYLGVFAIPGILTVIVEFFLNGMEKTTLLSIIRGIIMIVFSLFSLAATMMLIRVIAALVNKNNPAPVKEELQKGLRLLWPALLSSLLVGLAVFGGFLLLIIPAFIFAIWFSFVAYVVALEGKKGVDALHTSKQLVVGRWWAVCIRLIVPGIIFAFIAWLLQGFAGLPLKWLLNDVTSVGAARAIVFIATLVSMFIALIVLPLSTFAPTLLYMDLKKNPVKKD